MQVRKHAAEQLYVALLAFDASQLDLAEVCAHRRFTKLLQLSCDGEASQVGYLSHHAAAGLMLTAFCLDWVCHMASVDTSLLVDAKPF